VWAAVTPGTLTLTVLAVYAVASVVTFAAYGLDKRAAVRGAPRTRERTLHVMELAGGWPGALVGQAVFKHKRRKAAYMVVCLGIAVLHLAAWGAWLAYG
jgi:uncharacterized membrane protein YsdA (DUF1294 family)